MAPQNADSTSLPVPELPTALPTLQKPGAAEAREDAASEGSIDRIPVRLWVMHGAVMFGREFCYAMETALVTPILLQIGECPQRQGEPAAARMWWAFCLLSHGHQNVLVTHPYMQLAIVSLSCCGFGVSQRRLFLGMIAGTRNSPENLSGTLNTEHCFPAIRFVIGS